MVVSGPFPSVEPPEVPAAQSGCTGGRGGEVAHAMAPVSRQHGGSMKMTHVPSRRGVIPRARRRPLRRASCFRFCILLPLYRQLNGKFRNCKKKSNRAGADPPQKKVHPLSSRFRERVNLSAQYQGWRRRHQEGDTPCKIRFHWSPNGVQMEPCRIELESNRIVFKAKLCPFSFPALLSSNFRVP